MTCIGVIVTYNRKKLLLENLCMLRRQTLKLDKVLIIDNHSDDGTKEAVFKEYNEEENWIDYRYMAENSGGAGGFYYGVKYAYELQYDFIWLMDDDGRPFNTDTFERIMTRVYDLYRENKLLFINSLVTYDGKELSFGFLPFVDKKGQFELVRKGQKDGIYYGKANPFNGTLITREIVDSVGYPQKDFFMSRDEIEYMKRCEKAGAIIATIVDSIYYHPPSKLQYKKIGRWSIQIYDNLDKEYYFMRNTVCIYKRDSFVKIIGLICIRVITIVLYENKKMKRLVQMRQAIKDAKEGNMGKRKEL